MNANELADLYDAPYEYPEWGSKAQAILRQLQAENEALKANLEHAHGIGEAGGFIKGHKAALEKTLTDEEAYQIFSEAACGKEYDFKAGVRAILRKAQEK